MAILKNRAGVSCTTTGTGTITLGAAIPAGTAPFLASWLQFGNAGVAHGDSVRYLILDTNGAWEYGPGTYDAGAATLSRAAGSMTGAVAGQRSSTGSLLFLTNNSQVYVTAVAEDIPSIVGLAPLASPTFTGNPAAPTPAPGDNDTSVATTAFVTGAVATAVAPLAPLASPVFTGNPTGPTQSPGDNDTSLATTAFVAAAVTAAARIVPVGQCYLSRSGANLLLAPKSGNVLMINGVLQTIPDAGVTLAPTAQSGVAATTLYYIYAFMVSTVMTLEWSTSAYTVQAGTGLKVKTGDATRTLVGMWSSAAANAWSTNVCEGVSWFNPEFKTGRSGVLSPGTTSASFVEATTSFRTPFVSFAEREVVMRFDGSVGNDTNTASYQITLAIDGSGVLPSAAEYRSAAAVGSRVFSPLIFEATQAEGRHYVTVFNAVSTGQGFIFNGWTTVRVFG